MPAKNPAGGFGGGGRGGAGSAYSSGGRWYSTRGKPTAAQSRQNVASKTYKTIDPMRSDAAQRAAATRKANAIAAAKAAAKSNRAKGRKQGRKQGLKVGIPAGAAAGAAAGYASSYVGRGSEGPKKSKPVVYKKKTVTRRNRKATEY